MPIFWHNPLAEMYGPHFLALYLLIIVVIVCLCIALRCSLDKSANLPSLRIPPNPDPYEIAYLRGGANEVIRVGIYKLLKLNYLALQPISHPAKRGARQVAIGEQIPDPAQLAPIESQIIGFFERPVNVADLFKSSLPGRIDSICQPYLSSLARERLLAPPDAQFGVRPITFLGVALIVAFGGYKLIAAVHNGHNNVAFLILLAIAGSVFVGIATRISRVSHRGRRYLRDLQQAYGSSARLRPPKLFGHEEASAPAAVLALSIVGVGILAGTPDAAYGRVFARATANATGGCGSAGGSYTSSSCGSGGGGGGCGGGGGGCGGCGGGS